MNNIIKNRFNIDEANGGEAATFNYWHLNPYI